MKWWSILTEHYSVIEIKYFINHNLYGASAANKKLNLSDFCSQGISYGTIDILPSEISINGYLNSGTNDYKSALFNQEPASTDFFNALPYNTISFVYRRAKEVLNMYHFFYA